MSTREQALQSALGRLPSSVIVVDETGLLRPFNRKAAELFEREAIQGDLLRARPSHPLSTLINQILTASCTDPQRDCTLTFPSGRRYHVEPSQRSERDTARWLILLLSDAETRDAHNNEPILDGRWGFTPRERDLVTLLVRGQSSDEIVRVLRITPNTLKTHIKRLLQKTGTRSRTQLVAKLMRER